MHKILNINRIEYTAHKLHKQGKSIVLVGGCFDILHKGHIVFLEEAKKKGDVLFLLLESDENVEKSKGKGRPINNQRNRSLVLSVLKSVDYIIPLKDVTNDDDYDKIILQIKPSVIAQTKGDQNSAHRLKQCELVGARLDFVTEKLEDFSTTNLLREIGVRNE